MLSTKQKLYIFLKHIFQVLPLSRSAYVPLCTPFLIIITGHLYSDIQNHAYILAPSISNAGILSMKLAFEQEQGRHQVIQGATSPTWALSDCFIFKLNCSLQFKDYGTKTPFRCGNNKQHDSFGL